ncbi:MAG TPA: hypothetical protein VHU22_24775 [Xanthobacteraceae bacterium]|jgi:hypothetical protein|nr:hypothetical protein [Xanthobacteraceae bacterium]
MKLPFQGQQKRSDFSALMPVMGLLVAAMFAKLGVATQVLHLTHSIWLG